MSQYLIKEVQQLRQEVSDLKQAQQQAQQQVQEETQFSEDPRTQKILLQLWDHTQQLFRRIKDLEGEFYKDKQDREGDDNIHGSGLSQSGRWSPDERGV